jgi:adenylate cyclase
MDTIRKLLGSCAAIGLVIGTVTAMGVLALRNTGHFQTLELAAYDWCIRQETRTAPADPRLVFITITERDIQSLGRWPLTDEVLARALALLLQYRPRMIGLDLYRDLEVPPGHDKLDAVFRGSPQIIAVTKFAGKDTEAIPPPPALRGTDQVGVNDFEMDPGGVIRRGILALDDGENTAYSFALRLALGYLQRDGIVPQPDASNPEHLRLGPTTLIPFEANDGGYADADARGYQILLDYRGGRAGIKSFTLSDLLTGRIEPVAVHDKIVLIGSAADSVPDLFQTPYTGFKTVRPTPGVVLHGLVVSQLLRAALDGVAPIATWTEGQEAAWIFAWGVLGGLVVCRARSPLRFSLSVAGGLVGLTSVALILFWKGLWIPLAPSALAWLCASGLVMAFLSSEEKKQKALLMQLFSRHVSQEVAEAIWKERDQFLDGGRPRSRKAVATILFTDFRGFTALAEKMEPQALLDWLNAYLGAMAQLVIEHGGVIDDYAGDALKADFGVPLARGSEQEIAQDALNAVNCALAMEKELDRLNRHHAERRLPSVGMRIGIYTGPVVAGSVGTAQRLKYTTVGDTVNIASRLETLDRERPDETSGPLRCRILLGETTVRYLQGRFPIEQVGEVSLKGKEQKVRVFALSGRRLGNSLVGEEGTP